MRLDTRHNKLISKAPSDPAFPALKDRVIARTGHHYYADKDDLLQDRLSKRYRALNLPDAAAYLAHLEGSEGREEWIALETEITIGETFFFRYAEQFAALREQILPAVIASQSRSRALRIWSAGCSTGAEPYSVAILLHELLGADLAHWDIRIVGTDIDATALATARDAEYGRWALRTMPLEDRSRWFQSVPARPGAMRDGGYRLRTQFREMVRFERSNLMGLVDGSLSPNLAGFDLVLCRNVLIYFSAEHVQAMVRAFAQRLRPAGWLLIGHAEPNPSFESWLSPVALPGTIAYRRKNGSLPQGEADARAPAPVDDVPFLPEAELGPTPVDAHSVVPMTAPPVAEPLPDPPADPSRSAAAAADAEPNEELTRIRALADSGETGEAWRALGGAIEANPTSASLRYYEGLLARSLGRAAEAERGLRRALFLERDFVMAHFQLGLLLSATGRPIPAKRGLDNAVRLAKGLPADALLPEGDGVSASGLVAMARLALDALGCEHR